MSRQTSSRWRRVVGVALCAILACTLIPQRAAADAGAWKDRTQVVWSRETGELIRVNFRVWDAHPELDLDFLWEPRLAVSAGNSDMIVEGAGTLTWHAKGAPDYDRRFTFSVFKGVLKDGRPDGDGALVVRTGLSYTGQWHDGLMQGHGALRLENGDKYIGEFLAGKMHGTGKYTSSDGSIYIGDFRDGLRSGSGKLTLADGAYQTTWREGLEVARWKIPGSAPVVPAFRLAALSNTVKLKLTLDQKKASDVQNDDPDSEAQTYEADYAPGLMTIRLASAKILNVWKGDGEIASGSDDGAPHMQNPAQFAPVLFKLEVENGGAGAVQITDAFLDVSESTADLEPYLEVSRPRADGAPRDDYTPNLEFTNFGWGRVIQARLSYSLGTPQNRTEETTAELGTFDTFKSTSIAGRLRQLGVDTDKLLKASIGFRVKSSRNAPELLPSAFACPHGDQEKYAEEVAKCFARVKASGVLGRLKELVMMRKDDDVVYTTLIGRVEYRWTDTNGKSMTRVSRLSMDFPLIKFNVDMAEEGVPDFSAPPIQAEALSLDRRGYRVALPKSWRMKLAPGAVQHFDLMLAAPKSSQHKFRLVLQLSDGNQATSATVDLSYFRPRFKAGPH